ncbi:MAG: hypothetical protein IKT42_04180 [Clostridia bacterium]|nr:hypothetical protein [Clostridia bacterium]
MFNISNLITQTDGHCEQYYYSGGAYDTESTTITHVETYKVKGKEKQRTVIDSCFVYHIQFAIDENYYSFRCFADFIPFLRNLLEYLKNQENDGKFVIWVANMSHEWAFMKNFIAREFEITRIFSKTRRDVLLIEIENKIQFRESIGLFGHSLADISKNWCKKYKKLSGDLDYSKIRTFNTPIEYNERKYMENDVLILTEMHAAIFAAYMRANGVIYLPFTVSGFVRLKIKDSIIHDEYLTHIREKWAEKSAKWKDRTNVSVLKKFNRKIFTTADDWNLMREYAFCGGLSGSNILHVGKTLKNVKCADITSDYPFQMLDKKFPSGALKTGGAAEWETAINSGAPSFALLHIDEMRATTIHAVFSKHKLVNLNDEMYNREYGEPKNMIINNGKIVHAENVVIIINDVDFDVYRRAYDLTGITIIKSWFFEWGYKYLPSWLQMPIISDYLTKARLKKQYGHDAQNMIEYRDCKSRVNTYYGTLSTRPHDIFNSLDEINLFIPEKEFEFSDLQNNAWLNPYWAFYVTSYARKMLIDMILKYPDCIIQYDTDSLYYINNDDGAHLESELKSFNERTMNRNRRRFKDVENVENIVDLGTWDFDDEYTRFMCLGAKKYIKEVNGDIITTVAGLPKRAVPAEILKKRIKNPFTYYNALLLTDGIIIDYEFTQKLASAYNDTTAINYVPITDYRGETVLQEVSSYHALIPIDFKLSLSREYIDLIEQEQKIKRLK